jgi:WD40 repeat protein/tRNA A-37 threonylcarbamoyl transferase component Bud32
MAEPELSLADARTLAETPADQEPLADEGGSPVSVPVADLRRYTIIREFAHGGLGRILEAEDHLLGRKVAIKELRTKSGNGRGHYSRFLREAMTTARLQHPSIIPIYDVGQWQSGEPYYAMKLVSGRPLDAVIADAKTLDSRLALVPHVIAVADAIAYAHNRRIIHRDLKPANVLVGEFGETVVIDWGLGKHLDEPEREPVDRGPFRSPAVAPGLTAAGEVIGTPTYMAPEQAAAETLDERADVYAIGSMLYELLTGVWPHSGRTASEVIARLIHAEPVRPVEDRQPGVPAELATIVRKAMSRDRAGRYASASDLASDLRRFQTGQLVAAHEYSRGTMMKRWVSRHRGAVGVASVMLTVLAGTVAMSMRSISRESSAAKAERDRMILAQARGELERDPTAAIAWLKTYPNGGADPGQARELALDARARGVARYVLPRLLSADMGQFSPDGRRFAQPEGTGLRVIDLASGATVASTSEAAVNVAWSPDGQQLVVQREAAPRQASIIDLHGGTTNLEGALSAVWPPIEAHVFSDDGTTVVAPTIERGLRRYRRAGGPGERVWTPFPLADYAHHGDRFASLRADGVMVWWDGSANQAHALERPAGIQFVPNQITYLFLGDGSSLAAGTSDGRLCVWSLPDGAVRVLDGDHAPIEELTASRDGKVVITLAVDGSLRAWAPSAGTSRALPAIGAVNDIAPTPDGSRIVAGRADHALVLVDVETGDHRVIGMHPAPIYRVAMSPDGRWAASDGDDHTTRLWRLPDHPNDEIQADHDMVGTVAISDDGRTIVTGARDHKVLIWAGNQRIPVEGHADQVWVATLSADGKTIATGGSDQKVRLWDVATGAARGAPLDAQAGSVTKVVLSSDGRSVISAHLRGDVRVWDVASGTSRVLGVVPSVRDADVSPDRKWIAAGDDAGLVHVLSVDGKPERRLTGGRAQVWTVRFSPDGQQLAGGSEDGDVIVWDLATGSPRVLGHLTGHARLLAYSSDGRQLAAASSEGAARLWDLERDVESDLVGHVGDIAALAFVDGGVVTGGEDGTVRLWSRTGTARSLLRVDGELAALAVPPDGRHLAAGTSNGIAYRWSLDSFGAPVPQDTAFAPFLDALTVATIDGGTHTLKPH